MGWTRSEHGRAGREGTTSSSPAAPPQQVAEKGTGKGLRAFSRGSWAGRRGERAGRRQDAADLRAVFASSHLPQP